MKLGLFTSGYQFTELEKAFSDAAFLGYDYIELWGGRPHAYAPDLRSDSSGIKRLIDKYGMPVKVYTPEHNGYPFNYMNGGDTQWESSMEYLENALAVSRDIGASYMLVSVGHSGAGVNKKERLRKSLQRLERMAEKVEIPILMETLTPYESDFCTSLNEFAENLPDSPFLNVVLDVVAPFSQGEDPADYARVFGKRLRHLHLVDNDGLSDTHLIPGDGVINLEKVVKDLLECGYEGDATIELVTNYINDSTSAFRLAAERVRKYI